MSEKGMRFRPMLIREVARVAGEPRETIRTRLKQGIFGFEQAKGWKRFSDFETIVISIHARLKRETDSDNLAQIGMLLVAKSIMDEWKEDETGVPYFAQSTFEDERFMLYWLDEAGAWKADIFNSVESISDAVNNRFSESYSASPTFTVVNLRTHMLQTLLAMMKVQLGQDISKPEVEK